MTLLDYFALTKDVAAAIARFKEVIASAESSEEVELLAARLKKACEVLSRASCKDAGGSDLREAARLILEGKRLVFAVKVRGRGEEFPKLCNV
jgi:hypothetical protein